MFIKKYIHRAFCATGVIFVVIIIDLACQKTDKHLNLYPDNQVQLNIH
jgi:hypothetical protein